MQNLRYPGIRPFTAEDQNLFFGRNEDVRSLLQLIATENLIVLYGKAGFGKTSLLNAGVIPELNKEGNFQTMLIRFGTFLADNSISPLENFSKAVQLNVNQDNFIHSKLIAAENVTESKLWYLFKSKQFSSESETNIIVFIDQFEDLFTYPEKDIAEFKKVIAELINVSVPQQLRNILKEKLLADKNYLTKEEALALFKSINIKIVFSIRSDKLSLLNRLSDYLPNILKKCYELKPLTEVQARSAIQEPAKLTDKEYTTEPYTFDENSLNEIIRFLNKDGQQNIETFILQLVCHHVEAIAEKKKLAAVSTADLGDLQNVSRDFYENVIGSLNTSDQLKARIFIEEGLIFEEDQRRIQMYEGQIIKNFVRAEELKKLLDSHLLRSEQFSTGGFTYELCHDILVPPILKAKSLRLQTQKEKEEVERIKVLKKEAKIAARKKTSRVLLIMSIIAVMLIFFFILYYRDSQIKAEKQQAIIAQQFKNEKQNDSIMTIISAYVTEVRTQLNAGSSLEATLPADTVIERLREFTKTAAAWRYYAKPYSKGSTCARNKMPLDKALKSANLTVDSAQYKMFLKGYNYRLKFDSLKGLTADTLVNK
ncbi:MAG: hypothetical protein LH473_08250 [Chitinophagales bacterium]|nr:hypothetical protein [Chitinophagales bacterium]